MILKIYAAPEVAAVGIEAAKAQLRIDGNTEDGFITELVSVAIEDIETMTLHKLITQTWDLYLDDFPGSSILELPFPPLQSITGIYYTPDGGSETEFAASNYIVDIASDPGRVSLVRSGNWPSDQLTPINGVKIRFVCGFGDDETEIPKKAKQAILLLVGHYYENREAIFSERGANLQALPMGVTDLIRDLRMGVIRF